MFKKTVSFYHIALSKLRCKTDLFDNLYGERSLILLVNPQRKLFQAEEETDEEKQFRAIYKKIAGEVSTFRTCVFLEESRHDTHTHNIFNLVFPHQDLQVCANELQTIMKNVLSKREQRLLFFFTFLTCCNSQ